MSSPSFFRQLGDLPARIYDELTDITRRSTVPIILNKTPLGSGTLVKVAGRYGILTAQHVLNPPNREKFDTNSASQILQTTDLNQRVGARSIKVRFLKLRTTTRLSYEWGPDMGFILLPDEDPFTSSLKAQYTFYDLSFDTRAKLRGASSTSGFNAFCGFVDEERHPIEASHGFESGEALYGYAFPTGPGLILCHRRQTDTIILN